MDIEIYVVGFNPITIRPADRMYIPLLAGASINENVQAVDSCLKDNFGENISDKNAIYSEFTAVYWMWKHAEGDIIGENHYRRYFIKGGWINYINVLFSSINKKLKYVITEEEIKDIFNKGYNCILPKKMGKPPLKMKEFFKIYHREKLLGYARTEIDNNFQSYAIDFENCMESKWYYTKCIFVMEKENFNNYCEWLFTILFNIEQKHDDLEWRELAYLAEQLMPVWVEHNIRCDKLRIKELFYVNLEMTLREQNRHFEIIYPRWFMYLKELLKTMRKV